MATAHTALRIGIDVGGTNTDAVVMRGRDVRAACKTPTTPDVGSGIRTALADALRQAQTQPDAIGAVMIGTTHFTNAFVQARSLARVGALRLAAPATTSLPPFVDWPDTLRAVVEGHVAVVHGGYNYDGSEIARVRPEEVRAAAETMRDRGVRCVAISSVFAPVNDAQERLAASIVKQVIPGAAITMSHAIGRVGLLERENAAIMNASLAGMADDVVRSFGEAVASLGIRCPFYVSQNDGTLMPPALAATFPVL
ncbi:MAG: hydantoinase/oxoprolinase N-terminal domain-containing protein, partial [Pseudomonadota bacterium]